MTTPAARLEVIGGKASGMSIVVEDELLIGRHAEGAGRLADDEELSRSHARLALDSNGLCAIEDLGSTNGTFVNGLRISSPQTLSVDDTIEVGQTTLVVRELPARAAAAPAGGESRGLQPTIVPRSTPSSVADELVGPPTQPAEPAPGPPSAAVSTPPPAVSTPPPAAPTPPAAAPAPAAVAPAPPSGPAETAGPPADAQDAPPPPIAAPPTLALRLEIDYEAPEARLFLADDSQPVRLIFDGVGWRLADAPTTEEGGSQ